MLQLVKNCLINSLVNWKRLEIGGIGQELVKETNTVNGKEVIYYSLPMPSKNVII